MISVIIPVYNADRFLGKSIGSVTEQKEVSEILLVNDGSTDDSLRIMKSKAVEDSRIQILEHKNGQNHGRSATRNLGIQNAKNDIIAFLDADDYYLPGRFKEHIEIVLEDGNIDGVYGHVGIQNFNKTQNFEEKDDICWNNDLTITPTNLFTSIAPIGDDFFIHANALTVRKDVFEKSGMFNENFEVAEDVEMWSRIALLNRLVAGDLSKPIAIRTIHDDNVFNQRVKYKGIKAKLLKSLLIFSITHHMLIRYRLKTWCGIILALRFSFFRRFKK